MASEQKSPRSNSLVHMLSLLLAGNFVVGVKKIYDSIEHIVYKVYADSLGRYGVNID